ncbi:MAG: type II toxin-antitoxin system PemK/MazF family toxin [Proteobacteria bacterium]|nr:type II toxin-antitoxin system PemK/MazF family toxin [Pseudomonadota bacterium]
MVNSNLIPKRFDVFLVKLDQTQGSEIQKTRPCVIISPNEMNMYISTVIVAPMTTKSHSYPTRVPLNFDAKEGYIVLDQIRTIDKERLIKKLGYIEESIQMQVLSTLTNMFTK